MSNKLVVNETLAGGNLSEITGSHISSSNKTGLDVVVNGGTSVDPKAKYVEAVYTNSDKTITYNYYESASKVTLYTAITTIYSVAQDTSFTSAAWA